MSQFAAYKGPVEGFNPWRYVSEADRLAAERSMIEQGGPAAWQGLGRADPRRPLPYDPIAHQQNVYGRWLEKQQEDALQMGPTVGAAAATALDFMPGPGESFPFMPGGLAGVYGKKMKDLVDPQFRDAYERGSEAAKDTLLQGSPRSPYDAINKMKESEYRDPSLRDPGDDLGPWLDQDYRSAEDLKKNYPQGGEDLYGKPEWVPPKEAEKTTGKSRKRRMDTPETELAQKLFGGRRSVYKTYGESYGRSNSLSVVDPKGQTHILNKNWPEVRYLDLATQGTWKSGGGDPVEWLEMVSKAQDEIYLDDSNYLKLSDEILSDNAYRYAGFRETIGFPIEDLFPSIHRKNEMSRKDAYTWLEDELANGKLDDKLADIIGQANASSTDLEMVRDHQIQVWARNALIQRLNAGLKRRANESADWWDEKIHVWELSDDFLDETY